MAHQFSLRPSPRRGCGRIEIEGPAKSPTLILAMLPLETTGNSAINTILMLLALGSMMVGGLLMLRALYAPDLPWFSLGNLRRRPPTAGTDGARSLPLPVCWMAVRTNRPARLAAALGLHSAYPRQFAELLAQPQNHRLLISPCFNSWVLVSGQDLPDPVKDVDQCFRFLMDLSQRVDEVQWFLADPLRGHHGWVRIRDRRVDRAYVWADITLWNQGDPSRDEIGLGLRDLPYAELPELPDPSRAARIARNVDQVANLAARWGLSPHLALQKPAKPALWLVGQLGRSQMRRGRR